MLPRKRGSRFEPSRACLLYTSKEQIGGRNHQQYRDKKHGQSGDGILNRHSKPIGHAEQNLSLIHI